MVASHTHRNAELGPGSGTKIDLPPGDCSPDEVRGELQRILGSHQFDASERNRRFLEYVIEERLAGRAGRIKAYSIATQVFGRDANFDPQLDPVVRMEARRLRRSLERFYLTDGKSSPVRIAMPKGGYVPEFAYWASDEASTPDPSSLSVADQAADEERGAAILVTTFDVEGDESLFLHFNRGFTDQIVVGLSRFAELSVFDPGVIQLGQSSHAPYQLQSDAKIDFVLSGSTSLFDGALNVKAVLALAATGRVVWARTFERKLHSGDVLQTRDDVANMIVRTLAEPYGIIFNRKAKAAGRVSPDFLVRYYQYKRSHRRDLFAQTRLFLEHFVAAHAGCAEACGCLSQIYSDGYRFGFAVDDPPATLLRQAALLAGRALELDPDSSRGHHAKGVADWLLGDASGSVEAMLAALALNPNATEVMAELGLFRLLAGDWDGGASLLEEAFARNPAELGALRFGLSLYQFMNGRHESALAEAHRISSPDIAYGCLAAAISSIRLGHVAEAGDAVERLIDIARSSGGAVLGDLAAEGVSPVLAGNVRAALADAGLPAGIMRR